MRERREGGEERERGRHIKKERGWERDGGDRERTRERNRV